PSAAHLIAAQAAADRQAVSGCLAGNSDRDIAARFSSQNFLQRSVRNENRFTLSRTCNHLASWVDDITVASGIASRNKFTVAFRRIREPTHAPCRDDVTGRLGRKGARQQELARPYPDGRR